MVVEFAVPYRGPMVTRIDIRRLEQIQRTAAHVILGHDYVSYKEVMDVLGLESLESRRNSLVKSFAVKTANHHKFSNWFVPNLSKNTNTRKPLKKWKEPHCRTHRYWRSPLPFYTRLLNEMETDGN